MKQILFITWILISMVFISTSCSTPTDTPKYTFDQVLVVAQNTSPYCRIQTVSGGGSGWCSSDLPQYEEAEPVFTAEYAGYGIWNVNKTCSINPEWDRKWLFYEDTGEMVIRQD